MSENQFPCEHFFNGWFFPFKTEFSTHFPECRLLSEAYALWNRTKFATSDKHFSALIWMLSTVTQAVPDVSFSLIYLSFSRLLTEYISLSAVPRAVVSVLEKSATSFGLWSSCPMSSILSSSEQSDLELNTFSSQDEMLNLKSKRISHFKSIIFFKLRNVRF